MPGIPPAASRALLSVGKGGRGFVIETRQDGKQGERNLRHPCSYPTCAIRGGKLFLRKRSRFLELIGSLLVAVPADYTRYL